MGGRQAERLLRCREEPELKTRRAKVETRNRGTRHAPGNGRDTFIPLSYIDDVNSVRVGKTGPLDDVLEEAAAWYRLKWDRSKDWKNKAHLRLDINAR